MTDDHMTADEIKELRKRIGYTQERLARTIGVSIRTVMNWEQNRGWPNQENAERLRLLDTPHMKRLDTLRDAITSAIRIAERHESIAIQEAELSEAAMYSKALRTLRAIDRNLY